MILFVAACEPALGHPTMSHVIPLDGRPVDLAAGDLDRDGRIDLVIANADGTVAVRLQRDGWIAREACPSDARGTLAVLTPAGLAKLESAWPTHRRGGGAPGSGRRSEGSVGLPAVGGAAGRVLRSAPEHSPPRVGLFD